MATEFDHVKFYNTSEKLLVNAVSFSKIQFLPRVGDIVDLPGEGGVGQGTFDVVGVYHTFAEDPEGNEPSPAQPMSIRIDVKRRTPTS